MLQPKWITWGALTVFIIIVLLPIISMVIPSFVVDESISFDNYKKVFSDSGQIALLLRSLSMAGGAAFLSLLFGHLWLSLSGGPTCP